MSTEVAAPPQDGNLEIHPPEPLPEELFAAHVAQTREADILDIQRSLKGTTLAGVAIAAVSGLTFTAEKLGFTPIVGVGVATLFSCWRNRGQKKNEFNQFLERMSAKTQEAVGHRYELYRLKDGTLAMHWRGTTEDSADTAKSLEEAAMLAERHGIQRFLVDERTSWRMHLRTSKLPMPREKQNVSSWLKEHKGVRTDFSREMFEAKPQEWVEYARKLVHQENTWGIQVLVQALAKIDARHPLVLLHRSWQEDPARMKQKMLDFLVPRFQTKFSSAETQRHSLKEDRSSDLPEKFAVHTRIDRVAHIDGDEVVYKVRGVEVERAPLLRELGGRVDLLHNPELLACLLESPQNSPRQANALLTYLIYKECCNVPQRYVSARAETPRDGKGSPEAGFQEQIAMTNFGFRKDKIINPQVQRRMWKLYGGAMLAGVLSAAVAWGIDARYDSVAYDANKQLVKEQGLDREFGQADSEDIRARMNEWSHANEAWAIGRDVRKAMSFDLGLSKLGGIGGGDQESRNTAGVGNVGAKPDRSEYKLHASGMSTEGYWWQSTSEALIGHDDGFYWLKTLRIEDRVNLLDLETSADLSRPFIRVEHTLTSQESHIARQNDLMHTPGHYVLIPVRSGTLPYAVVVDGKPIKMAVFADNTYAVYFEPGQKIDGKLEYWLEETKSNLTAPRANRKFSFNGITVSGDKGGPETDEVIEAKLAVWEKYVPGISNMDYEARRQAIDTYLSTQLDYSFNPFDKDYLLEKPIEASLIQKVLEEDEANCNVAATTRKLSVENPNEIGIFGHLNAAGAGSNILSTRERHMALVDESRNVTDVTPPRRPGDDAEAGKLEKPKNPLQPWMLIPGVLGMAGLAYYRRRQLTSTAVRAGKGTAALVVQGDVWLASRGLRRTKIGKRALAAEMAEYIAFAPVFDAVAARAKSETTQSKQRADALLREPYIHDRSVAKQLAKQPGVPWSVRRTLWQARRLSRAKKR